MTELTTIIRELSTREKDSGLYNIRVKNVPVWRLLRNQVRTRYLVDKGVFNNYTNQRKLVVTHIFKGFFISLYNLLKICVRRKQFDNIVYAFPRLVNINGTFVDKYTDPVIDSSCLDKRCLVLQRPLYGVHYAPRYKVERVIKTDSLDYISVFISFILLPFIGPILIPRMLELRKRANGIYKLGNKFVLKSLMSVIAFLVKSLTTSILYKVTKPKRIFVVNRSLYFANIVAAKKAGIAVYELQHGVTQGDTILYSGPYDPALDPDYFLAFGEVWMGPQFGIPLDRIINIGWAYKSFLSDKFRLDKLDSNCVLVTSSPDITKQILDLTLSLSKDFPNLSFYIRLHPQEGFSTQELKTISKTPNIKVDDSSVDSALSISRFDKVIGENSSVLYEALSMGKMVGRVNLNGLRVREVDNKRLAGFSYIDTMKDMTEFLLRSPKIRELKQDNIYDNFKPEAFRALR